MMTETPFAKTFYGPEDRLKPSEVEELAAKDAPVFFTFHLNFNDFMAHLMEGNGFEAVYPMIDNMVGAMVTDWSPLEVDHQYHPNTDSNIIVVNLRGLILKEFQEYFEDLY